jgi:uncharacterized protein
MPKVSSLSTNWVSRLGQLWLVGVFVGLLCTDVSAQSEQSCHLVIPNDIKAAIDLGAAAGGEGYHDTGIRILRPIADRGDRDAQYQLGVEFSLHEPKDTQEAFKWFLKAAEQGHMEAHSGVIGMYRYGDGVNQDDAAADEWFGKLQEQERADYLSNGCNADAPGNEPFDCLRRMQRQRAAQGNPEDEFQLGKSYEIGQPEYNRLEQKVEMKKDPIEAVKWYRRAAKHGSNDAAAALGLMYESGKQITQDYKKAADLYLLAAKRGDEWSQHAVGILYQDGKGVRQNFSEAAYWYQKSAEQGNPYAALSLGRLHFFGTAVPQNDEKALYWTGSAACYGLPQAKSLLEFIKLHPGGWLPTPAATPQNTNSLGTTVAQDLRAYKTCLHQYSEETSKCDALGKAYKADLELFRTVLGVAR